MNRRIRRRLRDWFGPTYSVSKVEQGLASDVYQVTVNGDDYAFKCADDAFIEGQILRGLESCSVATPSVYGVDRKIPAVGLRWICGTKFKSLSQTEQANAIENTGTMIARLHDAATFDRCGQIIEDDSLRMGFEAVAASWSIDAWPKPLCHHMHQLLDDSPAWTDVLKPALTAYTDELELPKPTTTVLVHSDVVPSNFVYAEDGRVKSVLDFGKARCYPSEVEYYAAAERLVYLAPHYKLGGQELRDCFMRGYEDGAMAISATPAERRAYRLLGLLLSMRDTHVYSASVTTEQKHVLRRRATNLMQNP